MSDKIYFCLLILCEFLCQGIVGVTSGNVVRRKRVINSQPGGETLLKRGDAKFVVNIKELPGNLNICVGAILSKYTVITAAGCVAYIDTASIKVVAGSAYSTRGVSHYVIEKKINVGKHPHDVKDGIALITVQPFFIFNEYIGPIEMHQGALMPGTLATVYGWGCNPETLPGTNHRYRLRSITLTIMSHQECVDIYRNRFTISDKDICTYDPHKHCGNTDSGAPFVVNNKLAGLYLWTGITPRHINPDVFAVVQHLEYSQWIRNNTVHHI